MDGKTISKDLMDRILELINAEKLLKDWEQHQLF